jgi:hypothetical protein
MKVWLRIKSRFALVFFKSPGAGSSRTSSKLDFMHLWLKFCSWPRLLYCTVNSGFIHSLKQEDQLLLDSFNLLPFCNWQLFYTLKHSYLALVDKVDLLDRESGCGLGRCFVNNILAENTHAKNYNYFTFFY